MAHQYTYTTAFTFGPAVCASSTELEVELDFDFSLTGNEITDISVAKGQDIHPELAAEIESRAWGDSALLGRMADHAYSHEA